MCTQAMQQKIAEYFKTQPVLKVWLFGSYARGEETPISDVDILVQFDDDGVSLLKHAAMICDLEKILDRPVSTDGIYEIYTLPHTEEDVLTKLTVTALDANDNIIKERTFENIPITRNQVTRYTGSFFGSGGGNSTNDGTFRLTADPDWDAVNGYTF